MAGSSGKTVINSGSLGPGWFAYEAAHPGTSVAIGGLITCAGEVPTLDVLGKLLAMGVAMTPELAELSASGQAAEKFDWRRHLFEVQAPVGSGGTGLDEAVNSIASLPLSDVSWAVWLVRDYAPGSFALVLRSHHGAFDGVSLVTIVSRILGGGSRASKRDGEPLAVTSKRPSLPSRLAAAWREAVAMPGGLRRAAGFLPDNAPLVGQVHHVWTQTSWRRLRAIAVNYGASPNDVYLAAVAGALRAWNRDPRWPGRRPVQAMMPIDRRGRGNREELGNHFKAIRVPLPCDAATAAKRLAGVKDSTRRINVARRSRNLGVLFDFLPRRLGGLVIELDLNPRRASLITSQIPGPARPLSIFGLSVTEMRPLMFLPAGHRLGVCMTNYAGKASINFVADRSLPRIEELAELFLQELDALEATKDTDMHTSMTGSA